MQQILALLAFAAGVFLPCFYRADPGYLSLFFAFIFLATVFYFSRWFWAVALFVGLAYGSFAAISFH